MVDLLFDTTEYVDEQCPNLDIGCIEDRAAIFLPLHQTWR